MAKGNGGGPLMDDRSFAITVRVTVEPWPQTERGWRTKHKTMCSLVSDAKWCPGYMISIPFGMARDLNGKAPVTIGSSKSYVVLPSIVLDDFGKGWGQSPQIISTNLCRPDGVRLTGQSGILTAVLRTGDGKSNSKHVRQTPHIASFSIRQLPWFFTTSVDSGSRLPLFRVV